MTSCALLALNHAEKKCHAPAAVSRRAAQAVATDKTQFATEVANYFTEYFQTQTLQKKGVISANWVRNVAEEPFLDYSVAQVKQVAQEAEAWRTIEVIYSDITTHVDEWQPGASVADPMLDKDPCSSVQ